MVGELLCRWWIKVRLLFHQRGMLFFINQVGFTAKRIMNRSKTSCSQSFLCICQCPQNVLVSHLIEKKRLCKALDLGAYPKRYQHQWHFHITGFHHNLVKLETNLLSVFIKRFLYSYTFTDSFMSPGFYLSSPCTYSKHKCEKSNPLPSHLSSDEIGSF